MVVRRVVLRLMLWVCACAVCACADAPVPSDAEPGPGVLGDGPCMDEDRDGYFAGLGCEVLPLDCNDIDAARHPERVEICDGVDNDCDNIFDEGSATSVCELVLGVCAGARRVCFEGQERACAAERYGAQYVAEEDGQANEAVCDGLDNDCDGDVDENCACQPGDVASCGTSVGLCKTGFQRCVEARFGACEGAVLPEDELCDAEDNDCDGEVDEALNPPPCVQQEGVCLGSVRACGGGVGWLPCGAPEFGESFVAEEDGATNPTLCDDLDNDCDGEVDEGCECLSGQTSPCSKQEGVCEDATIACAQGTFPVCTAQDYGADYREEEADNDCDDLDNDCDGEVDEACP